MLPSILFALLQAADPKPVESLPQASSPRVDSFTYVLSGACAFGMVVGAAGDVNKDGVPDVIIGDEGSVGQKQPPVIWVISGRDGTVLSRSTLRTKCDGWMRVQSGDDLDADGAVDILVSLASYKEPYPGQIVLLSSKSGAVIRTLDVILGGQAPSAWASFVQDRDGDGVRDIGYVQFDPKTKQRAITIASSASGESVSKTKLTPDDALAKNGVGELIRHDATSRSRLPVTVADIEKYPIVINTFDDRLGALSGAVVGPTCAVWRTFSGVVLEQGSEPPLLAFASHDRVDVFDTKTGDTRAKCRSQSREDFGKGFGCALAPLDDLDGDGCADLAIGESEWMFSQGAVHAVSGRSGKPIWTSAPPSSRLDDTWRIGFELANVGDLDGDHVTDLISGTWGCKAAAPGRAFLISGKTGVLFREFRRDGEGVKMTVLPPPTPR